MSGSVSLDMGGRVARMFANAIRALGWGLLVLALPAGSQPVPDPVPGTLTAQTDSLVAIPDTTARTWHIEAGTLRAERRDGELVADYGGGVRLRTKSTTIDAKRARLYREREHIYFYEKVVVRDSTVIMHGDEGEFLRPADWAELRGRVRIVDSLGTITARRARYERGLHQMRLWGEVDSRDAKTRIQADSVLYHEDTGLGDAWGHVVLTDLASGSEARGEHALYDRATGEARIDPQPVLVLRAANDPDTHVVADDVRMNRDQTMVRAYGRVRIERGGTTAVADTARLFRTADRLELRGHPVVQRGDTRLQGESIDVSYRGGNVERAFVRGAARVVQSRPDTTWIPEPNVVEGDSATLFFESGELRRAVVLGGARSTYVPAETQKNRISLNEAQADSAVILFAADDIEEVVFTGNASGIYRYYEGNLDSLGLARAHFDSTFGVTRGDTTAFDFRRRATEVKYSAERILYIAKQNDLHLQEAAQVEYGSNTLRAGLIHYDADTDLLDARERPVLVDSGDRIYGDRMGYDMETRDATIEGGSTQYDQGFYTGNVLRQRREGEMEVQKGRYTTCDLASPHYHFECDQMKIILKNKVIGRPVRMYLGRVPIGWLPFIVNSVNTDRHSGFLQPYIEFGVAGQSRFIRGLDYYWAASEYYDFIFTSEYQERPRPDQSSAGSIASSSETRSVRFGMTTRYKVRYKFDGNLTYNVLHSWDPSSRAYTLNGSHQQKIGERSRLSATVNYSSTSTAYQDIYQNQNYDEARSRQINSGLTYSRPSNFVNLDLNLRRTQQLSPNDRFTGALVTRTMPGLLLGFRQIHLVPVSANPRDDSGLRQFLRGLTLAPRLSFTRNTADIRAARDTTTIPPGGVPLADSFVVRETQHIQASTGASLARQTPLWIFNVTPSVSYSQSYLDDSQQPNEKHHTRRLSTALGATTTFYGLVYPRRFGLTAIRHQIEPSATINYIPEIGGQQQRATSISMSLRNQIDVKLLRGGEERRRDGVFAWSLSTSYDPTKQGPIGEPDRKFGNISSGITLNRGGALQLTIDQTYDPYIGRIISTRIPFAARFTGGFDYGEAGEEGTAQRNRIIEEEGGGAAADSARADSLAAPSEPVPRPEATDTLSDLQTVGVGKGGSLKWDLGLSYSLVRDLEGTQSGRVGLAFKVQPTRAWEVAYRSSYDTARRELGAPEFRLTRDLHCWKASFARVLTGGEWRYYFRIWVDRHTEDIFLESGERSFGY